MLIVLAWAVMAAGLLLSFAMLLSGPKIGPVVSVAAVFMIVPATWVARRVHGFPPLLSWGVASVGALFVLETIVADSLPPRPGIDTADLINLAATAVIIFMTALVVRRRRGGLAIGDLLDGLIITSGAWLVSWVVFVEPFVNSSSDPSPELIITALALPAAMPLLALAALLVFGSGRTTPTVVLLATALLLNGIGALIDALDGRARSATGPTRSRTSSLSCPLPHARRRSSTRAPRHCSGCRRCSKTAPRPADSH